jgi:hypothetical protein
VSLIPRLLISFTFINWKMISPVLILNLLRGIARNHERFSRPTSLNKKKPNNQHKKKYIYIYIHIDALFMVWFHLMPANHRDMTLHLV